MEKKSSEEAMKMFKVLNSMKLTNSGDPVTPVNLEDEFAKLMGSWIPYWK